MKKVFIILPLIFIILIAVVILILSGNGLKYEIEEIGEYNYFKIYEKQKYGVIDKSGNIIVEPEYDVVYIPNPSKPIFVCYYNYNSQEGEYNTKVFNDKLELLFTDYEKVEAFLLTDTTTQIPFEKSVLKYKKDGKYGIIDFEGKQITQAIYDSIESLQYKEGCFVVEQNGKFGVINLKGNKIVSIKYDSIMADGYYNENTKSYDAGFIVGQKTDEGYRYGYVNYKGKVILEPEYNEINRVTDVENSKNIYLVVFKNGKAGLMKNKKAILNNEYEEIEYSKTNQLFAIQKNSKQGIVDINGKQILPIEYDSILFSGESINAVKDGQVQILNKKGEKQESEEFTSIIPTSNENYIIITDKDGKYGVINKDGNIIIKNNYQYIEYAFSKYFIVTNEGKVGILNDEGKAETEFKYDIIQRIGTTNTMQAIDLNANVVDIYDINSKISVSMENANIYTENGYIKILSNIDRKYIDNNGKVLSNKDIFKNNSLFATQKDGKWGFADKNGNIVVQPQYDMVTEFNNGYAGIKLNNKWGVIDDNANIIVDPSYKVDWDDPDFISRYCKLNFGYGFEYYTDEL